jgi:AcrR family transcriptional regulator
MRTEPPAIDWTRIDLSEIRIAGVTPSRQQRSRDTTAALLRAGADLLRRRSLDELSIEALCADVGATIGAFYSRFQSKEVYFNVLLELAARDATAHLALMAQNEQLRTAELAKLCHVIVGQINRWMYAHEGVVRAALKHGGSRPDPWNRFKMLARSTTAGATPILLRTMGRGRQAEKTRSIAFGFQVVFGTLVNAVLNDPGPLSITDAEMTKRLGTCLLRQLKAEITLTSPAKKPARKTVGASKESTAARTRRVARTTRRAKTG